MTVKQMQCLLCCLGLYDGAMDGIRGPKTRAAEDSFRSRWGREPDKEALLAAIGAQEEQKDWWQEIRWFRREEFACKCGRCGGWPGEMSETLLRTADRLREHFGAPALVSSGLRCPEHNARVGGAAASRHMTGKAMDLSVAGKTAAQVLAYAKAQPEIRYAYAIDDRYIHMDVQ